MKTISAILISFVLLPCILSKLTFPVKRMLGDDNPPITFPLPNSLYIDIQLGTPPQNISALIDTGFGYFMISPSSCNLPNAQVYDFSASTTVNYTLMNNTNSSILYYLSDRTQNVEMYADTLTIGGYPLDNAEFLVSNTCAPPVFGFGVRNGTGFDIRTIAESMAKDQDTEQIASLYLPANNSGSSFILGGYDQNIAPNGFTTHNSSNSTGFWAVNITDFGLGTNSYFPESTTGPLQGALTSGWKGINAAPSVFLGLVKALPGELDCNNVSEYPNLYFVIDDVRYEIPPSVYFAQQGLFSYCQPAITAVTEGIQIEENQIFLGSTFFNAFYTSFNIKHGTVGFAALYPTTVVESISE